MDKTRFWAERLYVNSKISSHIYYAKKDIPEVIGIGENEEDPFLTDPYLEENLRKMYEEKRAPVLTIEDGWVAYMAFSDAENNFYIGGPVSLATDKEEKSGSMADYNIFMAMVEKIGHDKRGTPIFKRDKEGNEILIPEKNNVYVLDETSAGDRTVAHERKTKIEDDQTPDVPEIFAQWKKQEGLSW